MNDDATIHFEERQRFTQWWLWLIVITALVLPAVIFLPGLYQQLVVGEPWGNRPMSDAWLITLACLTLAAGLLPLVLIAISELHTLVRDDGLWVRFRPFHLKLFRVDTETATSIRAVQYNPISEYGGWGLRYRRDGKAYNVTGNHGVGIDYPAGKHILIGSQRHEALAEAIRAITSPTRPGNTPEAQPAATESASD